MLPQEIIRTKRDGGELSAPELAAFFKAFLADEVADYQVSALLMAIWLKGMTRDEAASLTTIMRDSGVTLSWPDDGRPIIDKHSTGGVGDKTSMILLPLAVLEGLRVPMIAGRGLGHTGGTLDKLEAIGVEVYRPVTAVQAQMQELGGVFMGQTEEITPLDRRLYALRDVTATVESIPLIVGSILSKKLAEGLNGLVMDVKFGSGAFMAERSQARELAEWLVAVGKRCELPVEAALTTMNEPLGTHAGNGLEMIECFDILQGQGPASTRELCLELAADMVGLAQPQRDRSEVLTALAGHLDSGRAWELFKKVALSQGAKQDLLDRPERLATAPIKKAFAAPMAGFVEKINVRKLGLAIIELGGGRRRVTDTIDPRTGLTQLPRIGDPIEKGQPLCEIHAADQDQLDRALSMLADAFTIGANQQREPLIAERVKA